MTNNQQTQKQLPFPVDRMWSRTMPFPPGWWQMYRAVEHLGRKDFEAARKFADLAIEENNQWKQDVKNLGFAPFHWVVKLNDAPTGKELQTQPFDPAVLRDWVYSHNG